ncbi:MAG: helix-turn-helix transcriptional regulator [Lachnospiraceae bacterium]|nr:helix-turn-helix transcriptional regulator [Lachnospiraceae bacterium]
MEKKTFSSTLATLRKEKKVTQEQLANHLGVSAQAVSKWENGSYPEGDLIPAIADFFDVSIDFLYGRGEKDNSIANIVFNAARNCCIKDVEETHNGAKRPTFAKMLRNIEWATQNAPWVNNKNYYEPPRYEKTEPKMAAAFFDDYTYSYMGLMENNDLYIRLNTNPEEVSFEDILKDTDRLCEFFKLISDKDTIRMIAYLYSLARREFVGAETIAAELKLSKDKVEKTLNELVEKVGNSSNSPFQTVTIVEGDKEKKAYGTNSLFGGVFMATVMIAKEYVDCPAGFQMMIDTTSRSWTDRKKL